MQLQAIYYWKSFNILASWGNPVRNLTGNSNIVIHGRSFHMLSAGWGNGKWTILLQPSCSDGRYRMTADDRRRMNPCPA